MTFFPSAANARVAQPLARISCVLIFAASLLYAGTAEARAFDCKDNAEICGPSELSPSEVDGPYVYVESQPQGSDYSNLTDGLISGTGCGNGSYGCELMRLEQATESAAFRFDFLDGPQTIFGFVIWNDRGTTGDGVAELEVVLYDAGDNIVAAFETPMEDLTTEHSIFFGDPALPAGTPGALQGFPNISYAVWRIRSFHGDPGPDPHAHQLREVGFNPVTGAGYEVIATEFDATGGSIPADTALNDICNHPCPSKIRRVARREFVYLRAGLDLPATFDPETAEFEIEVFSDGASVWNGLLMAGDVTPKGWKWNFRDRAARGGAGTRDGIAFMSMSPNNAGIWRWRLKAFGDFSGATSPEISVVLDIDGTNVFARTATWQERSNGFVFDLTNP